jgi:hypothetical protein
MPRIKKNKIKVWLKHQLSQEQKRNPNFQREKLTAVFDAAAGTVL